MDGKGDVGRSVLGNALDNHVDIDVAARDHGENSPGHPRFVPHIIDRYLGLVALEADAANDDVFHVRGFLFRGRPDVALEAGAHFEFDAEFLREFDRARLHYLGAGAGHFEQLVVGNLVELLGVGHDPRIAGEDSIDVGKDLAGVGIERAGQRDRGQVGAAPAEGRDCAVGILALKTGDDDDVVIGQQGMNLSRRDICDLRPGMRAVRQDARFRAGQGNGFPAEGVHGHGGQGARGQLAGGEQRIELALRRLRRSLARQLDQAVGHAGHGGDDGHDAATAPLRFDQALGHLSDALGSSNGSAAVLLDDQAHGKAGPG